MTIILIIQSSVMMISLPHVSLKQLLMLASSKTVQIMSETYCNFKAVCKRHLDYICLNSSCHGANWAMKIESTKLKVFLQIFAILLQFCILGAFIQLVFFGSFNMQVKQEFPTNDGSFPNVTICSHRMFDKKRITGLF